MDVFLVPVGGDAYELYSEVRERTPEVASAPRGPVGRLVAGLGRRLRVLAAAAERERRRVPSRSRRTERWPRRLWRAILRHLAETIAEQRLLWQLRRETEAALVYPADLAAAEASARLRRMLARDRDRHRLWLAVDALLAAITGLLLVFVPGPNVVAYYFVFRFVGHYLAWRGARSGLDGVSWRLQPSAALTELRAALALPRPERDRRVRELAARLGLGHLDAFVRRTAG